MAGERAANPEAREYLIRMNARDRRLGKIGSSDATKPKVERVIRVQRPQPDGQEKSQQNS